MALDYQTLALIEIVDEGGRRALPPNPRGLPPLLPSVPAPRGMAIFDLFGRRVLGWTGGDGGANGVISSLVESPDQQFGFLGLLPGTGPPEDATVALAWPPRAETLALLVTERTRARQTRLRLVEYVADERRLRYRPETLELGYGPMGRRTVVDDDGRLYAILAWQAKVVAIQPFALTGRPP